MTVERQPIRAAMVQAANKYWLSEREKDLKRLPAITVPVILASSNKTTRAGPIAAG
jgi:hypothetical protein